MNTVTIEVSSQEASNARMLSAFSGEPQGCFISFPSFDLLWKTLTPNRMALIHMMTGAGPMSVREAARRAGRDVRAVHADITVLANAGILSRTEKGGVEFPYDAVHVDFMLRAA